MRTSARILLSIALAACLHYGKAQDSLPTSSSTPLKTDTYFAYNKAEDRDGVIAPWYKGQNGQLDFRMRVAAETLKRYPWHLGNKVVGPAPEFLYMGQWAIADDGTITVPPPERPWTNGDLAQRASILINALTRYYAYSGDASCIGLVHTVADYLAKHCGTSEYPKWPDVLVSVPVAGIFYGKANPKGYIQLDITAEGALALVTAYQLSPKEEWLNYALHQADLFAKNADLNAKDCPWPRYANPGVVRWGNQPDGDIMTGGVVYVLRLFDELMRMGYYGENNSYLKARNAGLEYFKRLIKDEWFKNPSLGYNYWDWKSPVSNNNVVNWAAEYIMDHPDEFPDWQQHVQNILTLHLNRTSASPNSGAGVYSGAWAYPESSGCCRDSLSYTPQRLASSYLRLGAMTGDYWAREIGRRQILISTYDALETGVIIDGFVSREPVVAKKWFKIATAVPLKFVQDAMAWYPKVLAPNRENHLLRSPSTVRSVVYGSGRIDFEVFAAPEKSVSVMRLAFAPKSVKAEGQSLKLRNDLDGNGYTVKKLAGGDAIIWIRHDGQKRVVVEGSDPQKTVDDIGLKFTGNWRAENSRGSLGGKLRESNSAEASVSFDFTGNQVRLIGRVDPQGGRADVFIDGVKQAAGIDCWCPETREQQVLFSRSGLSQGRHSIKVVVTGQRNPLAQGDSVYIDAVQFSAAQGDSGFGSAAGPQAAQRVILGYPKTKYTDQAGNVWRPFSEVVARLERRGNVEATWWTEPRAQEISGTADPELYRHGMHAHDFTAFFTVPPGAYKVRLHFAETRNQVAESDRKLNVLINGERKVSGLDISQAAGGFARAHRIEFDNVPAKNGTIAIQFIGTTPDTEAIAQAIEILPGRK